MAKYILDNHAVSTCFLLLSLLDMFVLTIKEKKMQIFHIFMQILTKVRINTIVVVGRCWFSL